MFIADKKVPAEKVVAGRLYIFAFFHRSIFSFCSRSAGATAVGILLVILCRQLDSLEMRPFIVGVPGCPHGETSISVSSKPRFV